MRKFYGGRARPVQIGAGVVAPARALALSRRRIGLHVEAIVDRAVRGSGGRCDAALRELVRELAVGEAASFVPVVNDGSLASGMRARMRANAMGALEADGGAAVEAWCESVCGLVGELGRAVSLPDADGDVLRVTLPLIGAVRDPARVIESVIKVSLAWSSDEHELRLGGRVAGRIKQNLLLASGLSEEEARKRPQRLVWPRSVKGATPSELVEKYLGGSVFEKFFAAPVSWGIDDKDLVESMWCMARTGHGKSVGALEYLIASFLRRPDPPSLVIMENQGDMSNRIAKLKVFAPGGRLHDRLILIDPREMECPVALNAFALRRDRLAQYPPWMLEQLTNTTVELLEYLFGAVLGAELTPKMGTLFRFLVRLLLAIPGANIVTLRDALETPERFAKDMERMEGSTRAFFEREFFKKGNAQTRDQILRRLWSVFENPVFERMFSSTTNKVDLFERLQAGSIVIVNTDKDFLGEERSVILGRTVIAMTVRAICERAAIPTDKRRPTFLVIDECHEVLDEKVEMMLTQSRKQAAGLIAAHQYGKQVSGKMRAALTSQTAIKLIGSVHDDDAKELAPNMGCSMDFLMGVERGEFSLHVQNKTRSAVRVSIPLGVLNDEPRMTEVEWEQVRQRNRERYGEPVKQRPAPVPVPRPVDDDDWRS